MAVLRDRISGCTILTLIGRGLTPGQIDHAMRKMVGVDWSDVYVAEWRKRLLDKGFMLQADSEKFVDDLEALITGTTKLREIQK